MDYIIRPTLQHISLAKIAIQLWIQNDFLKFVNEPQDKLEAKVLINVQNLNLPNQLKKELKVFIKPIGLHIFEWFKYLHNNYHLVQGRPKAICWTPYGTINRMKSIKVLLMEQRLSLKKRFKLACDHCLFAEIESLWKGMTDEEKLQQEKRCNRGDHLTVQQYWINNYLTEKPNNLYCKIGGEQNLSPYYDGCCRAMLNHNPTAIQYFFQKLSSKEKEVFSSDFRLWLSCNYDKVYNEAVCFLLSQINKNEQAVNLKKMPGIVLSCLLSWPYQCFFLESANRIWEFLSTCDFEILLIRIIDKMASYGDEYRYIFLEFWSSSPNKLKGNVIRPDHFPWQELYDCFKKGQEFCKIISNNANGNKKKLLLLIGDMRIKITIHSKYSIELLKILYKKNDDPQKILYHRYH